MSDSSEADGLEAVRGVVVPLSRHGHESAAILKLACDIANVTMHVKYSDTSGGSAGYPWFGTSITATDIHNILLTRTGPNTARHATNAAVTVLTGHIVTPVPGAVAYAILAFRMGGKYASRVRETYVSYENDHFAANIALQVLAGGKVHTSIDGAYHAAKRLRQNSRKMRSRSFSIDSHGLIAIEPKQPLHKAFGGSCPRCRKAVELAPLVPPGKYVAFVDRCIVTDGNVKPALLWAARNNVSLVVAVGDGCDFDMPAGLNATVCTYEGALAALRIR